MSKSEFELGGELVEASVEKLVDGFSVSVSGETYALTPCGENHYWVIIDGQKTKVAAIYDRGTVYVDIDSALLELKEPSEDGFAGGAGELAGAKDKIFAPMPGKIVKLQVAVGDSVTVKQPMVIVEAMKMENQVNAKAAGIVKAINFAEGDQVDTETPIIELELSEE